MGKGKGKGKGPGLVRGKALQLWRLALGLAYSLL